MFPLADAFSRTYWGMLSAAGSVIPSTFDLATVPVAVRVALPKVRSPWYETVKDVFPAATGARVNEAVPLLLRVNVWVRVWLTGTTGNGDGLVKPGDDDDGAADR